MDSVFEDIATVTILPEYGRQEYFIKHRDTEYKKASRKNRKAFAFDAQSQFILLNQPGS